ncbi:MAG TPA: YtxH domain-containing protein [Candidatus Dojkabacteria bacterium]|nr:YtxH domain-containing protein [Candidatus Dojkabacteria bacterium]HQG57920.1 YtxH domain-containing protein [Candidatus Dojkabacteria bacterium]
MARTSDFFSFVMGLTVGAAAGAVAGILLAPKSGEATRKELAQFSKELGIKAEEFYTNAKDMVEKKVRALKRLGTKIDKEKYITLVSEVVDEIKKDGKVTARVAQEIGDHLKSDWEITKNTLG